MNNLELPRYVISMEKSQPDLDAIVSEMKAVLRNREAIASLTNEGDLRSAEAFRRVNRISGIQCLG